MHVGFTGWGTGARAPGADKGATPGSVAVPTGDKSGASPREINADRLFFGTPGFGFFEGDSPGPRGDPSGARRPPDWVLAGVIVVRKDAEEIGMSRGGGLPHPFPGCL